MLHEMALGVCLGSHLVEELATIVALCGRTGACSTLLSGGSRLAVSVIGIRGDEGDRFGAFRLYLPSDWLALASLAPLIW